MIFGPKYGPNILSPSKLLNFKPFFYRRTLFLPNYPTFIPRRFAYTDKDVTNLLKKNTTVVTDRYSSYDSNAGAIIKAVRVHDFNKVRELTKTSNINGHDWKENTPLTDAASRGDNDAIKFLITEMKANIHASCDCPHNKTALHYAAENGHHETVRLLLRLGANPNILDSRKYTALDVAKTEEVKQILISSGSMNGSDLPKVLLAIPRKGSCKQIK